MLASSNAALNSSNVPTFLHSDAEDMNEEYTITDNKATNITNDAIIRFFTAAGTQSLKDEIILVFNK